MATILRTKFFNRPAPTVARELLGKFLVRRIGRREIAMMITETEAYEGPNDKASHASRGKTPRNAVMFGPAGIWYVYFTYGMHWMLNVVTGVEGYPAAVLIRGAIQTSIPVMPQLRHNWNCKNITGPARLTKFLKIDKRFNGKPAVPINRLDEDSQILGRSAVNLHSTFASHWGQKIFTTHSPINLWIEDRGVVIAKKSIRSASRIGVAYAGAFWAKRKYRFFINPSL